jgi:hypothetical protein
MATYSVWMLGASQLDISGGGALSGTTQGDGSHLVGRDITLTSRDWQEVRVRDDDRNFDDNDGSQRLDGPQVIDGVAYRDNLRVEAEYRLELEGPDGARYTVYGFNVNEPNPVGGQSYGTAEGLVFQGAFPPAGVPLRVISAHEGPNYAGNPALPYAKLAAPICFTPGTRIAVPGGWAAVERLAPGDRVLTRDRGAQPLVWVGLLHLPAARLRADPALGPLRIRAHAFGPGRPERDLVLSPQHRVLLLDPRAELLFGAAEVLAASAHLADGDRVRPSAAPGGVTYLHLACARHEILCAEGLAVESLRPGPAALAAMGPRQRAELLALWPELAGGAALPAARPLLRRWETALLAHRAPRPELARAA